MVFFKKSLYAATTQQAQMYKAIFGDETEVYTIVRQKHIDPGEYHYFATFVVSLGVTALQDGSTYVARIWADGELIYDVNTGVRKTGLQFTFFDGNENQGPVYRGMHYRGQMVLLFDDLDLNDYGGSIPAISAELIDSIAETGASLRTMIAQDDAPAVALQLNAVDGVIFKLGAVVDGPYGTAMEADTGLSKRVAISTGVNTLNASIPNSSFYAAGEWASAVWFDTLGVVFISSHGADLSQTARLYRLSSNRAEQIDIDFLSSSDSDGTDFGKFDVSLGFAIETGGTLQHFVICAGDTTYTYFHIYSVATDKLTPLWASSGSTSDLTDIPSLVAGKRVPGMTTLFAYFGDNVWKLEISPATTAGVGTLVVNQSVFYTSPTGEEITKAVYDSQNDRLICFLDEGAGVGYAVSIDTEGATEWTSDAFTLPVDKGYAVHTQEASSDTSQGSLVTTTGTSTDVLTKIDLGTGELSTINLLVDIDPAQVAIWNSRDNRLYLPDLTYIQVGVPESEDEITLDTLVRSYGALVGYDTSDITTVNLDDLTVKGFIVSSNETYQEFLNGVGQLYGFNWLNDADHITVKYPYNTDGALVVDYVIDTDRLAYVAAGQSDNTKLRIDVSGDSSIPAKVMLSYFNIDNDYIPNTQVVSRSIAPMLTNISQSEAATVIALTADDSEAQSILYSMLSNLWEGRNDYSYRLPSDGITLLPTDIVQLTVNATEYQVLIKSIRINADFSVTINASSIAGAAYPAKVEPQPTRPVFNGYNPARAVVLDIPDLVPTWTAPHSYNMIAVIGGYVEGAFTGATMEAEGADGWEPVLTIEPDGEGYIGTAIAVPGLWAYPEELDTINAVYVRQDNIPSSYLVSASDAELEEGANLIALVNGSKAELVQFKDVEEISPGVWRLYNLLRGRYGTEVYTGIAMPGAPVAFMDRVNLIPYNEGDLELEMILDYRVRSPRQSTWEVATDRIEPEGDSRRPYAPVDLVAERQSDDDLLISWRRRGRYTNTPFDPPSSPPLDEALERYMIEFYTDLTFLSLVNSFEVNGSNSYLYTATQQSLDGLTGSETTLFIRVYQLTAETVTYGFTHDHVVSVVAEGAALLSAVMRLGGELVANPEIQEADTLAVGFALGGAMSIDISEPGAVRASFELGGAMTLNIREPVFLGASASLGGSMAAVVGVGSSVGMSAELGGAMAVNVENEAAAPFGLRYFGFNHETSSDTTKPRLSRVISGTGGGWFNTLHGRDAYQAWSNNFNRFLFPETTTNEVILGVRLYHGGSTNGLRPLLNFGSSAGALLANIIIDTNNDVVSWSLDGSTWNDTAHTMAQNTWIWVSVRLVRDTTDGVIQVAVDGTPVVNLTGINTGSASDHFHRVAIMPFSASTGAIPEWDDLVLTDGAGPSPFNGLLPDMTVSTIYPTSDVSNAWTLSTGSNAYAVVDETRVNTTDYMTGVNGAVVELGFPSWGGATPLAVQANVSAIATSGDTDVVIEVNNNGASGVSANRTYDTTYGEWDAVKVLSTDEWGSDLADLQVKLTAPASDGSARVSSVVVEVLHLT